MDPRPSNSDRRFAPRRPVIATLGRSLVAVVVASSAADAQSDRCESGEPRVGQLGIGRYECVTDGGCEIFRQTAAGLAHRFSIEPTVWGIRRDGPAGGQLRDGDAIVAVDGVLITTPDGGKRLANLTPGSTVTLRIRRTGNELDVRLTPEAGCARLSLVVSTTHERVVDRRAEAIVPPRATVSEADALERAARAARGADARVDFGMELACDRCGWRLLGDALVFDASEAPAVKAVEAGGPAQTGGIVAGDVLLEVNGVAFTSPEGGRLLGRTQPGDRLTFRVRRGDATRMVPIVARAVRPRRSF
ncbi:MAG TPA: PDZ domain-containing protein [Gemmatimonadaceae bacterium]|nr:PDZ domain-containing protein [Gemmatimonadaceae bacterium]